MQSCGETKAKRRGKLRRSGRRRGEGNREHPSFLPGNFAALLFVDSPESAHQPVLPGHLSLVSWCGSCVQLSVACPLRGAPLPSCSLPVEHRSRSSSHDQRRLVLSLRYKRVLSNLISMCMGCARVELTVPRPCNRIRRATNKEEQRAG